jgi:internalin A
MSKVLPLVIGLLLAVPSLYADDAEEKALKLVKRLGGTVTRDDKDPAHPVVSVDLTATIMTDAGLKDLAALKGLQTLDLSRTWVTDAGLKELKEFRTSPR